jgi:nucleoid-associated protein YejK
MLNFGEEKGKRGKSASEYAMEFMGAFDGNNFNVMHELVENWLDDFPEDANAHYAQRIFIGILIMSGNIDKGDAIKAMDLIAEKAPKYESADIILEGFYEQLFANFYRDIKGE